MAVTIFPRDHPPLELVPQQTGPSFEFFVKVGAEKTFLRAIALWTDNQALEGAPPTFQLQAPGGIITPVTAGARDVELSGEGGTAGIVKCQRFEGDIYLVTITEINEDVAGRDWKLRIRNNAAKALRFVWVSSDKESKTHQPWIALGEEPTFGPDRRPALLSLPQPTPGEFVTVRNWGTGPLEIRDQPNTSLGGPQSPVILEHCPAQIAPHGVDHMVIRRGPAAAIDEPLTHTFTTSDEEPGHNKTISIKVG